MAVEKTIGSTSLAEVIDRILDKGIVVDAWVRLSLVGIEILALEGRGCFGRDLPEVRRSDRPDGHCCCSGIGNCLESRSAWSWCNVTDAEAQTAQLREPQFLKLVSTTSKGGAHGLIV